MRSVHNRSILTRCVRRWDANLAGRVVNGLSGEPAPATGKATMLVVELEQ